MKTININISKSIEEATSQIQVVDIINCAEDGHIEGMEGVKFTPAQLAGQYAQDAAEGAGNMSEDEIDAQLDCLRDAGANFDFGVALAHGLAIAAAKASSNSPIL